ncbi:GTPase domain-containing protein [Pseudomonas sp.]|uniref:GTPase domain-containing protein n=1 Tax=Pseudomonas sp. TaxID=306 RepID=UPI0028A7F8F5|nr:GTPase domain-containing protein [Pseudomonas sp.]
MWWLGAPLVALAGKAIYDATKGRHTTRPVSGRTTLERNLERLGKELEASQGRKFAVLGQPGAGKSTLLRRLTHDRITPLPVVGIHTDATDWASDPACNLLGRFEDDVYVDVPGYDTVSHPASTLKLGFPFHAFDNILFVVNGKLRSADLDMFDRARFSNPSLFIARSFAESLSDQEIEDVRKDLRNGFNSGNVPLLFFSNRANTGIEELAAVLTGLGRN